MNELLEKLQDAGISQERSDHVLSIVIDWVNEFYPVAGAVANNWIREQQGSVEA